MTIFGITVLFIFDVKKMDSSYGYQAFNEIYTCLKKSKGICNFYDGDLSIDL